MTAPMIAREMMKRRMPVTILKTTYTAIAAARMTMSDSKRGSPFDPSLQSEQEV